MPKKALVVIWAAVLLSWAAAALGQDLARIKENGTLRHLGVPYANFVTGSGDGFSVELIQGFARYLGVDYQYVESTWATVIQDLCGKKVKPVADAVKILGKADIKGDVIATGLTILPWRKKIINYSTPTFPTQIWLMARAESGLQPIKPTGTASVDIALVKSMLSGITVSGMRNTCLDPSLYGVAAAGAKIVYFKGPLNQIAPAVINGESETCVYEVPDALNALKKWPGKLKIIGPLSEKQLMGCGFRKSAPALLAAFNRYLAEIKKDGTYLRLVKKYYADVLLYFDNFF